MSVVAIGDSADRVAEDFDRRRGDVSIVVRRTGLAEVLEFPSLVFTCLDVHPRLDAGEIAEVVEASVRARASTEEDSVVRTGIFRHNVLDVRVDDAIHRPVKSLARLHPAIEQPSPT